MTRIRVLLADDEPLVRSGLRAILESEPDMTVVGEADDGAAVIAQARRTRPDIVLMDVRMPRVDGIAATRQLGQFEGGGPAVIVVTTFENDNYVYDALQAGARGFLLKRSTADDFTNAIRTVHNGDSLLFPAAVRRLATRPRRPRPRARRGEPHRPRSRGPAAHRAGPVQLGDRRRAVPRRGDRQDPRAQRAGQARRPGPRPGRHHGLRERLHPLKALRETMPKQRAALEDLGNPSESNDSLRVHNFAYTTGMDDSQTHLSVRDARAHFAEVITRAQDGTPTIITRNGQAVAAVVPIEDFNALEDAIDRYFAREADRDLAENPDAPTYSMSEVVASIFEEEPGKGAA